MGLRTWIARLLGRPRFELQQGDPDELEARLVAQFAAQEEDEESFAYVMVPRPLAPVERDRLLGDPLHEALVAAHLGEVTGGGSQLGEEDAEGNQAIEYVVVDLELSDVEPALALVRTELERLHAPSGTELCYSVSGEKRRDGYDGQGWRLGQPRTETHPGLGL